MLAHPASSTTAHSNTQVRRAAAMEFLCIVLSSAPFSAIIAQRASLKSAGKGARFLIQRSWMIAVYLGLL
ncbi:MAG TPA: hypothetical protein VGK80_01615 [Rhodanobacteraceae bacterium]